MTEHARRRQIPFIVAILASLWVAIATGGASETTNVIPLPVASEAREGSFVITPATRVIAEGDAAAESARLVEALAPAMGFPLTRADAASHSEESAIRLRTWTRR